MLTLDRGHLTTTHEAAVELDEDLRAWIEESSRFPASGSITELVQLLRAQGDYWERVQTGRFPKVRRLMARFGRPFFTPQIRYNLLIADLVGRIEVALDELRQEVGAGRRADEAGPPNRS